MLWHSGDLVDAVKKVKELEKNLFVFVRDENTKKEYIDILETSEELHEILKNSICLNLLKDTVEYQQFNDVYGVTNVPSIFIISHEGKVIETITTLSDELRLCNILRRIYGLQMKGNGMEIQEESQLNSDVNETTTSDTEKVIIDDKMTEVRKLLSEKHKQKVEEEREKQKSEELNRRELGRQMHELKKLQKDREEEEIRAEIKRKRNEEKEARDKILRQIEEDKLERKQRYNNQILANTVNTDLEETQLRNRIIDNEAGVRLQFRFPDGSSVNHKFQTEDKFSSVRKFVSDHIRNNMGINEVFEIKQFFPRRTIFTHDDNTSLLDLQLIPSASFAVTFVGKSAETAQISVISWLMTPINLFYLAVISVLQWVKQKIGINKTQNAPPETSSSATWEERQKRLLAAQSRTIKKDGNLAGFQDSYKKNDDDDDEARWNGNSTQQM